MSNLQGALGSLALFVAVSSAFSCGPSLSGLGSKGVTDLKCPEPSIQWAALDNAYRATGCGHEAFYHKVCRNMGCDYENVLTGLRGRASFALGCPGNKLEIHYLDGLSYGVSGCEKRVIFAYDCRTDAGCTWRQEVASAR